MRVWVVLRYSYDPGDILGVYSSEEKAREVLINTGYRWEDAEETGYVGIWVNDVTALNAEITEHEVDL